MGARLRCAKVRAQSRAQELRRALKEVRDLGLETFVDPCPDGHRPRLTFMAEAASASGVRIICATGLYKEDLGNTAYFKQRTIDDIASVYISEINKGVATPASRRAHQVRDRQRQSRNMRDVPACGGAPAQGDRAPITTHTEDGTMAASSWKFSRSKARTSARDHRHSCGSSDLAYHARCSIADVSLGSIASGWTSCIPTNCG